MANRYGRDLGRQDRESSRGADYDRGYGGRRSERSGNYGWSPYDDDDENYFGSGRTQYGGGYSSGSTRDYDTYGSGYGRSESDYSDRESYGGYGSSRYGQSGSSSRSGYGSQSGRNRYGEGYSGRSSGYEGDYGTSRYNRFGGRGTEDFGRYGSDYPSSERGYMGDYDEGNRGERGWWDRTSDEVASWFGDEEAARRRRKDMREGGHRGRGPSGYTRSDDRIKEDINDRLTDYDYIDASNINVEVQNGEVTLTGTVETRYEKRMAEDIAEDISGVKNVENRLRVNYSSGYGQDRSSYTGTSQGTSGTTSTTGSQAKGKSSGT